jgi:hypothetical protein
VLDQALEVALERAPRRRPEHELVVGERIMPLDGLGLQGDGRSAKLTEPKRVNLPMFCAAHAGGRRTHFEAPFVLTG